MESPKKYHLRVDRSGNGERIDTYISRHVSNLARSQVKKLIEEGFILLNNARPKPNEKLKQGQILEIEIPPKSRDLKPAQIPLSILYEDAYLLAVDKPAGLVVHPSETTNEPTLVEALLSQRPEIRNVGERRRPGLVHRLDKETSGVLLIAKTVEIQRALMALFASHRVKKYYVAITASAPKENKGTVETYITRHPVYRQIYTVSDKSGRRSVTLYRVLKRFGTIASCLMAHPLTGRTHQVRVHLRHLKAPILCDKLYSSRKNLFLSELYGKKPEPSEKPLLERQALHSFSISFLHPLRGDYLRIKAPLPSDLRHTLTALSSAFPSQPPRNGSVQHPPPTNK
ncbi:MAG: RluA family pseudouridine synthase [Planctomycetota bacterium]|nr:RluA family pseudouridine synthase [Planctomycetota bacterium]